MGADAYMSTYHASHAKWCFAESSQKYHLGQQSMQGITNSLLGAQVQAAVRMQHARRPFLRQKSAVQLLQFHWRLMLARCLEQKRQAAVSIQR